MNRISLLTFIFISSVTTSCFLTPKKKSGDEDSSDAYKIVDKESIYIDRIGSGETAQVKFRTSKPAYCNLKLYSQDEARDPKKDTPREIPCENNSKIEDFVVKINELDVDNLYFLIVTVYDDKESKSPSESVLVKETPFTPGSDGDDPPPDDGKFRNLLVARLNIPLREAEIHRHTPDEPLEIGDIKKKVKLETGVDTPPMPYAKPDEKLGISKVATIAFAAAVGKEHPEYPGVRKLTYSGVNIGLDQWKFLYTSNNTDVEMVARAGNVLQAVEIKSTGKATLEEGQLESDVDALPLDVAEDLSVSWTTDANLLEHSYVMTQIGRPGYSKGITCIWDAKDKKGTIEAALLEDLEEGKHVVLVALESFQFIASKGWVISSYDWRNGRVERQ